MDKPPQPMMQDHCDVIPTVTFPPQDIAALRLVLSYTAW